MPHARAAILSMGDELTLGQTLNTNAQWLSTRLIELGIVTVEHSTVPDDLSATVGALTRLSAAVDLLISTGGLGPTSDDLCRHALAAAMGDTLVQDAAALDQITRWFAGRSRPMAEINTVQALRPSRARCLQNTSGTAPGLAARLGSCDVFCLPGPPREMAAMFDQQVRPHLSPPSGRTVRTRTLHTFGLGESDLATRLGVLMDRNHVPLVGTTASGGVVSIRIRYEGPLTPAPAEALLDQTEERARAAADPFVFGSGSDTLPLVVLATLAERKQRLAVVESCTGGLLGAMLTDIPGSSAAFLGGWITYSNTLKSDQVNVPPDLLERHGAVSPHVAAALAAGGLSASRADYCLAITGIAGPEGGTPDKPVGTVFIALASRSGPPDVRHLSMAGDRLSIREWSARSALAVLRFHLAGTPGVRVLRQIE